MNEVWKAIWESPGHWYTTSADAIMPMADHFLTFILQPVLMAVCHCDRLLFVFMYFTVVWQLKTWLLKAEVLIRLKDSLTFVLLFFFRSLFTYVVYVPVSVTFSLFLYCHFCLFPSLSSSVSFVPFLSFCLRITCISIRYFPKSVSRTKPVFLFWLMPSFKGSRSCFR